MTKKCVGCGITLQSDDQSLIGYTKDLAMDLCMRCFKLKHYNILINEGKEIDNEKLITSINKKNCYVLFFVDFLNIYEEVLEVYKKIKCNKALVITKSDLIPKNIKINTLIENIKNYYDIKEDVYYCSSKTKENISDILNVCLKEKKVLMAGFTNAGKSSIINALIGSDLTVSKTSNTTQDFIDIHADGFNIYDAPGFISKNVLEGKLPPKKVVPITYQIKSKYYLLIDSLKLYFSNDTNITIYMKDINIAKRKLKDNPKCDILIPTNSDLIIKGLGFIKFSKPAYIGINLSKDFLEVRPSIIGREHE